VPWEAGASMGTQHLHYAAQSRMREQLIASTHDRQGQCIPSNPSCYHKLSDLSNESNRCAETETVQERGAKPAIGKAEEPGSPRLGTALILRVLGIDVTAQAVEGQRPQQRVGSEGGEGELPTRRSGHAHRSAQFGGRSTAGLLFFFKVDTVDKPSQIGYTVSRTWRRRCLDSTDIFWPICYVWEHGARSAPVFFFL
jgi:hypothetical protein